MKRAIENLLAIEATGLHPPTSRVGWAQSESARPRPFIARIAGQLEYQQGALIE